MLCTCYLAFSRLLLFLAFGHAIPSQVLPLVVIGQTFGKTYLKIILFTSPNLWALARDFEGLCVDGLAT